MMMKKILPLLTFVSAVLAILAADVLHWPHDLAAVLKALTTILIIAWAWPRGRSQPTLRRFVIGGLLASLVGDIALTFSAGFVPGLLAFLVAHLAYLWAFTRVQRFAAWPLAFVVYGAIAAAVLAYLWSGIPAPLQVPVVAYVLCLASMAAQTLVIARRVPGHWPLAFGGLMFFCSDGLLALNKFAGPVPLAALLVLPTYWTAQWCIASWLPAREVG